ncbi:hypothetical protein CVT24_003233 [Panaeolus cyanescens]|uniref:G domain-containing protein n=1 Tax=Panaeolus cyanescens TaxID=181874 RepID=A0A409YRD5_9AGAR|nr:hypothetical protein CVT24_003233 [Panaeolus cyanescens]
MGISKDQLESFTKKVTAYEMVGAYLKPDWNPICLLDCPGFSDNSLSELEIVEMVNKWMKECSIFNLDGILYFCPITDTRLPGTRRKTMEMLKALVKSSSDGHKNEGAVTIVTTMWDQVWCPQIAERAERNYTQLKDGVWKDMIKQGACITKFNNTQESALSVLDCALASWSICADYAYHVGILDYGELRETGCGPFLYEDLISRIETARQRQVTLQSDLKASLDDPALRSLFEKEQKYIEYLLEKYDEQLKWFKSLPGPQALSSPSAVHVGSTTYDAPLDPDTTSLTTSTKALSQTPDRDPSDGDLTPSSHETAQPLLPLTPPSQSPNQNDIIAPQADAAQAEAATVSSTEPTQPPQASSTGTLNDTGRLPRRNPRGWMRALFRQFKPEGTF